jgi:hypothetical protein
MENIDRDHGRLYYDYVLSRLSDTARRLMEEIMKTGTYEWKSDFALDHIAIGKAEGEARSVLLFLAARNITVSDQVRERITSCADLDQLDRWVQRAATIDTSEQLFD